MNYRLLLVMGIAITILFGCGRKEAQPPSAAVEATTAPIIERYPILKYSSDQGAGVLLEHEATSDEKALFQEMDSAAGKLPEEAELDEIYRVIAPIGEKQGLSPAESIAFWARMALSEFEQ